MSSRVAVDPVVDTLIVRSKLIARNFEVDDIDVADLTVTDVTVTGAAAVANLTATGNVTAANLIATSAVTTSNLTSTGTITAVNLTTSGNSTLGNAKTDTNTFNGKVIVPGGSYTVGVDFPTIQAGIDYLSNGLKPDSNLTLNVPIGVYAECLHIDIDCSDPTWNDAGTDLTLISKGLKIVGADTRPIANMSYFNGGLIRTATAWTTGIGVNSLGTINGIVTLTNVGNTITVASTLTAPNFANCGVNNTDKILIKNSNGSFYERNVVSVSTNTVTYDGTPATITDQGASITFLSRVEVRSPINDGVLLIRNGSVSISGIWFSMDPALVLTSIYNCYIEGTGTLYASRLCFDARINPAHYAVLTFAGGRLLVYAADGFIVGHVTCLGGRVQIDVNSTVQGGDWYVICQTSMPVGGFVCTRNTSASVDSLQISSSSAGKTEGILLHPNSNLTVIAPYNAYNCTTGVKTLGGKFFNGNVLAIGVGTSTMKNCTTGILADVSGDVTFVRALVVDTATTGVSLNRLSRVELAGTAPVFTAVTTPRVVGFGCYLQEPNNSIQQIGSHVKSQQTTHPTVAGSADIASSTLNGSDAFGRINCTTSAGGVADSTLTITFDQAYIVAPMISPSITAASSATMPTLLRGVSTSTTNAVIAFTTPLGAGTAFTINYVIVEP